MQGRHRPARNPSNTGRPRSIGLIAGVTRDWVSQWVSVLCSYASRIAPQPLC